MRIASARQRNGILNFGLAWYDALSPYKKNDQTRSSRAKEACRGRRTLFVMPCQNAGTEVVIDTVSRASG